MKYIYILVIAVLTGSLSSCNDWLDVSPKQYIPADKMFESESGFKDILTGIYLRMGTTSLYAGDLTYAYLDEMAGLYSDYPQRNNSNVFNQSTVFDYDNLFLDKRNGIYEAQYNVISNINNLLTGLESHRDVLTSPHYYEVIKGEALGLRAFLYFDLLRLYGPIYSQHPTDAAIPYKTTFDTEPTPVLPANEVVAKIVDDLKAAEQLLEAHDTRDFFTDENDRTAFLSNREFRMNVYAVKAMLARVYCYAGEKALAVQKAQEVIDASKIFSLYKSQTASNYNSIRYGEQIFGLSVHELSTLLDSNFMMMDLDSYNSATNRRFGLTEQMMNQIYEGFTSDWRQNIVAFSWDDSHANAFCKKYNQAPLLSAHGYHGADAIPLIRLPEMYYIIAECADDAQTSVDALNTVRFARGISYSDEIFTNGYDQPDVASAENKEQTRRINEIMKEYRKEYFAEGQLFYFLKNHAYSRYYGCNVDGMTAKQYQMPLPDNEKIFGNNSKK